MAIFRHPGIICQTRDWYADIEDGTLARMPSPIPAHAGSPGSSAASPAAPPVVASGDCAFLNPVAGSSGTVRAPQAAFDRLRRSNGAARASRPQPLSSHAWSYGPPSAAFALDIIIGSQTIRVVRPTDADAAGKNLPTNQQLCEALRAVPANQLRHTRTVVLNFRPHPDSTPPGVHPSRTVAGEAGSGKIDLFPVNQAQSQNDFDNRVMHESGHNYQGHLWNSARSVQEWRTAATADNRSPSPYARGNAGDDFCEFNILYNAAKGTQCEAVARQLYPNRWTKRLDYESRR